MNAIAIEAFLARLYTDDHLRARFLEAPRAVALQAGLDAEDALALESIDRVGLECAADSFALKRTAHARKPDSREA